MCALFTQDDTRAPLKHWFRLRQSLWPVYVACVRTHLPSCKSPGTARRDAHTRGTDARHRRAHARHKHIAQAKSVRQMQRGIGGGRGVTEGRTHIYGIDPLCRSLALRRAAERAMLCAVLRWMLRWSSHCSRADPVQVRWFVRWCAAATAAGSCCLALHVGLAQVRCCSRCCSRC